LQMVTPDDGTVRFWNTCRVRGKTATIKMVKNSAFVGLSILLSWYFELHLNINDESRCTKPKGNKALIKKNIHVTWHLAYARIDWVSVCTNLAERSLRKYKTFTEYDMALVIYYNFTRTIKSHDIYIYISECYFPVCIITCNYENFRMNFLFFFC
jgi:hypothetical protein